MKRALLISSAALAVTGVANAALWVDFNSGQDSGPHNQSGYQAFSRNHEGSTTNASLPNLDPVTGDFDEVYNPTFAITGTASVTLTAAWPGTSDVNVRQSIDRSSNGPPAGSNDANWADASTLDLVTDFLGIDTRSGGGDWDGTTGTPTYMTLTLNGLAAGTYNWTSFHADTENVHVNFRVEIDTGTGFSQLADGSMTDATPADGNPDSQVDGSGLYATTLGANNTYTTTFNADGTNDVTLRFAPYSGEFGAVHNQIWGINGFQLSQVPEPSAGVLGLLGAALLMRRRRK